MMSHKTCTWRELSAKITATHTLKNQVLSHGKEITVSGDRNLYSITINKTPERGVNATKCVLRHALTTTLRHHDVLSPKQSETAF
jgi:hypothetical protein